MSDTALEAPGLARRGGLVTVAKVGTLVLQTIHLGVLARSISVSTFASFSAGMALLAILGALAEFGLIQVAVLDLASGQSEAAVVRASLAASAALITLALMLAAAVSAIFLDPEARLAVALLTPWLVLSRIDSAFVAVHQFQLRTGRLAACDMASRVVLLVCTLPLAIHGRSWGHLHELVIATGAFAVSEAVSLVIMVRGVERSRVVGRRATRSLLRRSLPLGLTNASSLVHARSDQVVLEAMGRRSGIGPYAIASRINEAMLVLANAAGSVSFAILARTTGDARKEQATRFIRLGCVLGVSGATGAFIAAPLISRLIGGDRYESAALLIRLLAPALAVSVANLAIAQLAITSGGSARLLVLAIGATVVNIVLTIVLVSHLGARGAAVATSITETCVLAIGALIAHRLVPGAVPWRSVLLVPVTIAPLWWSLHLWELGHTSASVGATVLGVGGPLSYLIVVAFFASPVTGAARG